MRADAETHSQSLRRKRALVGDLHQISPLGAWGIPQKREKKNFRKQRTQPTK